MNIGRIYRLLHVITLLQSSRCYGVKELGEQCSVARRTVFRDLKALTMAGIPVVRDRSRGGYRISECFFLPPTSLSVGEALAMVLLAREYGGRSGIPCQQAALRAAAKIEGSLPESLRRDLAPLADAVRLKPPRVADLTGRHDVYDHMLAAASQQRVVRIFYDSLFEGRIVRTRLKPYRLLFANHAWYVIGHSSMHRALRLFNLLRIRQIEPTTERFRVPRTFSVDRFLGNAWHLIRGDKTYSVVLRFTPKVARNVAEVRWHKTQCAQFLSDGSLEFRVHVEGVDEIAWWVLGYGDQVYVVEPACLRERVCQVARNMLQQYDRCPES